MATNECAEIMSNSKRMFLHGNVLIVCECWLYKAANKK